MKIWRRVVCWFRKHQDLYIGPYASGDFVAHCQRCGRCEFAVGMWVLIRRSPKEPCKSDLRPDGSV